MKNRIKEIAKQNNLTASQLSEILKLSKATINAYYIQVRQPTAESAGKIANTLNINVLEVWQAPEGFKHYYNSLGEWEGIKRDRTQEVNK